MLQPGNKKIQKEIFDLIKKTEIVRDRIYSQFFKQIKGHNEKSCLHTFLKFVILIAKIY